VINVTTLAATVPAAGAGIYGASKAALELLTKLWADEIANALTFWPALRPAMSTARC
jgi:NAD(P)-dependent dehydrogenase (short-subunit alcohol dehydrogenase family)